MPRRDPNQQDEHEPLLPLHTHRPPTAEQSQASASSTPPSQSSISLNATPTSPIIPAAVSLGTASKGKLQARRYLSTSPDSAKRPLLPQHADGAGVVDEEESWSGSGLDAPTDAGSSGIGAQASAQPTPRPAPNGQVRMSEKARGKQRARTISNPDTTEGHLEGHHAEYKEGDGGYGSSAERNAGHSPSTHADKDEKRRGRSVTVIFANEGPEGGKVDVWVEEGESVGMVKDRVCRLSLSEKGQGGIAEGDGGGHDGEDIEAMGRSQAGRYGRTRVYGRLDMRPPDHPPTYLPIIVCTTTTPRSTGFSKPAINLIHPAISLHRHALPSALLHSASATEFCSHDPIMSTFNTQTLPDTTRTH